MCKILSRRVPDSHKFVNLSGRETNIFLVLPQLGTQSKLCIKLCSFSLFILWHSVTDFTFKITFKASVCHCTISAHVHTYVHKHMHIYVTGKSTYMYIVMLFSQYKYMHKRIHACRLLSLILKKVHLFPQMLLRKRKSR